MGETYDTLDEAFTRQLSERYCEDDYAGVCPVCRSSKLAADRVEVQDSGFATSRVMCQDCGTRWRESWTVTSIHEIDLGDDVPAEWLAANAQHLEEEKL